MYSFELFEQSGKTAVIGWGRFNPPTIGHQKLVKKINDVAAREKGDAMLFMTKSHDPLTTPTGKPTTKEIKNPLTFDQKLPFAQKFFDVYVDTDPNLKTLMSVMAHLQSQGYKRVILVAGSDRVPEYVALLKQYNGVPDKAGNVSFSIPDLSVENAGMRDPDAEGVEGMSGTKLRQFAKEGDFANFAKGVPGDEGTAKLLYDIIRKNLGVKEDIMPASTDTISPVHESWSKKYKKSIDCSNPKGFSQKAHCAGRRARQGGKKTKSQSVSENLEGRTIDLTKNFPTYTSLIGRITKENPTKVTIEIVQADGPGNVKVGDELRIATNYIKRLPITENHHTDIPSMLEKFLPIAMKELGIAKLPSIKLTKHLKPHGTQASFGMYNPDDGKIYLAIADRHPVDILRTLAHELVHFSQDGKHELDADSGETGSREENEANSVAGIIMRKFNNEFPDAIKSDPLVTENKKKDKSVGELEQTLRNPHSYKAIDHAMQSIARKYKISASELHDKFVKHHGTIPDNWAKKLEEFVTANYGIGKTPGVLARVGPKGQVPRAKLHVNVPKKTAVKLGIPHTHLKEAFDAPYPMDWEHGDDDESYDALVTLPDGTNMSIMFSKEYGDYGEEEWQVEFYRNNSQDVTGEGDAQRIFATVLSAIQQFIKLEKPKRIKFSAAKQTGDMTPNASRTSLYNRLVQRFANNLGYGVKTTDYSLNTVYELERLREGVAEGMDSLDPFTRSVLNRMEDDSWLSAEHAYFITKGIQKKKQTNPEAYNQEIQRFVDLYKQYKGQQGVAENFADGRVKGRSRPGRVKAAGASCKGSVTDLRARAKKYSGEKGKMYHWCANMKAGKQK